MAVSNSIEGVSHPIWGVIANPLSIALAVETRRATETEKEKDLRDISLQWIR